MTVRSTPERPTRESGSLALAVGIVALEFAAAVSTFVASTLLPVIMPDLGARDHLGLLVAGSTLGLFVALPLSGRAVRVLGTRGVLAVGVCAYVGGLLVAATASTSWTFALGRFTGGLAGGLLAVFGVSAAIRQLDDAMRVRVVAASSAMWIAPALVGPSATLALDHLIGWRATLLVPIPVVLFGRVLVARAVRDDPPNRVTDGPQPGWRTALVPVGVAGILFGTWPVALAGAGLALIGVSAIMPSGTARLARGTPAALAALTLFALGYFGADSLITILLTSGYHTSLARAALVLSSAALAWPLASLVVARFASDTVRHVLPALGLAVSTVGVAAVALGDLVDPVLAVALTGWTIAGAGVGLAYPVLYLRASSSTPGTSDAARLAAAVITAESFGALLGGSLGGAISAHTLGSAYVLFAVCLAAGAYAATRSSACRPVPVRVSARSAGRLGA